MSKLLGSLEKEGIQTDQNGTGKKNEIEDYVVDFNINDTHLGGLCSFELDSLLFGVLSRVGYNVFFVCCFACFFFM